MASVFFSYTHIDESLRDQLEIHLSLMKREGLITAWHDRRIVAGSDIDDSIDEQLESADIILLLVSANFIASEYCFATEMKRAMERHKAGEARVIPVILRACDWHSAPFGKLNAVPTDGRPVTSWPNQDEAFANIAKSIRAAVSATASSSARPKVAAAAREAVLPPAVAMPAASTQLPRSSNMRVKHQFSDLDRDTFVSETFDFIARFFDGSLQELEKRHGQFQGRFTRIDARRFTASIYKDGKSISQCSITQGGAFGGNSNREITYSSQISTHANSFNEALTIAEDSQTLYLKPMMNMARGVSEKLSDTGAAEYLWSMLMEPVQR
ncbi:MULTISPECIES: toll/interleukin-1 receptor domain-containing protein [Burkholderia cepacia complex]|uniref:toll/interleukin-1 receptor domain-containing protein n=1 Tax=Burkholderia cenocepacia TaxID=95486 RepID=UPI00222FF6EE|nr:toll/interleukin-1 receptor domain-containing protein [Burkholderia cenocepacia]MCW3640635.1 toll/interleukin-1 receptor domain-containing protein [Burkholderia cenocepacia]